MVESQVNPDMSESRTGASNCTDHRTALAEAEIEALVHSICFKTGPPRSLRVEVELSASRSAVRLTLLKDLTEDLASASSEEPLR